MSLDSRVLTHLNCYAKKFATAGRVEYRILAGSSCATEEEAVFTIEVGGKPADEGGQHDVEVRFTNRAFVADPPHLHIQPGDMVLWHGADATVPGFAVRGEGPGGEFYSGALAEEAVYTHAFGAAGMYEWTDAYGGVVSGVVEVVAPEGSDRAECEKWVKSLAEGALIHVVKGRARPDRVQILPGQTVFWAVESAPGITITDKRLLR
jgi:plastocyanin